MLRGELATQSYEPVRRTSNLVNLAVHLKSIIYIRQNSQIDTAVRKSNVEHLFDHLDIFVQG